MSQNDQYDEYDMKMSEWRGYVVRALEDTNKELKEIKDNLSNCEDKIDHLNSRLTNIQVKVATIGGTSGVITSIVLWLITRI